MVLGLPLFWVSNRASAHYSRVSATSFIPTIVLSIVAASSDGLEAIVIGAGSSGGAGKVLVDRGVGAGAIFGDGPHDEYRPRPASPQAKTPTWEVANLSLRSYIASTVKVDRAADLAQRWCQVQEAHGRAPDRRESPGFGAWLAGERPVLLERRYDDLQTGDDDVRSFL